MAKFRCIICNDQIELNKFRGFKIKENKCKCGGAIEEVYNCKMNGRSPLRVLTSVNNNHVCSITKKPYYNAWRNRRHGVFIINSSGKFEELNFSEHNNFDFYITKDATQPQLIQN